MTKATGCTTVVLMIVAGCAPSAPGEPSAGVDKPLAIRSVDSSPGPEPTVELSSGGALVPSPADLRTASTRSYPPAVPSATGAPVPPAEPDDLHLPEPPATMIVPRFITAPEDRTDAASVARHVVEVWGNAGPDMPAWHLSVADYITADFARQLSNRTVTASGLVVSSQAIAVADVSTAAAPRFAVTLEQAAAIGGVTRPGLTLVVVEVLLTDAQSGWLVASLQVRS